jgi:membrane protease YdiL (CAAX protease family)
VRAKASGLQLAFLTFAVALLCVPIGSYLLTGAVRSPDADRLQLRVLPFAIFATVLVAIRPIRMAAAGLLAAAIPRRSRVEVLLVCLAMIPLHWATTGARALWAWWLDPSSLASMSFDAAAELERAWSPRGLATFLLLGLMVAPFLEELLFRGFLYRAFERDWGWPGATIATSIAFGLYHPFFLNAFVGAIVFACVVRRTGSLRSSMVVHAFSNLMAWWPMMGQYIGPHPSLPKAELSTWGTNLVALAIGVIALPLYVWMSRDRDPTAPTALLDPNAALQK